MDRESCGHEVRERGVPGREKRPRIMNCAGV